MRLDVAKISPVAFLFLLLVVTWFIYKPGLGGGFIFDDYPNLEPLGEYGGVVDWETFKSFALNGISGPLGRPISLASFLLDDNTWPSEGNRFKPTNLKIHLLNGLLLIWGGLLLLRLLKRTENRAVWIALLSGAIWMLHPYMVSTTLYVIQRMAQLSALFMFAGLVGYLKGRLMFERNALAGYAWMSISLFIGTTLAVFSKENGILLPVGVAVIELCLPNLIPRLSFWWRLSFLWGPTLIVIIYLVQKINLSNEPMAGRSFTQLERVLTQPRILWEYLHYLYVPHIEGRGLFQDGYQVSRGLFSPISTLSSIVALAGLWGVVFKYRKKFPLLSIAILFFFACHLLESTWLNLELYFEHRSYAASAFLFLPIAAALSALIKFVDIKLCVLCVLCVLVSLSFLTWQRASLWGNTEKLELYWAASSPESARAQNRIGTLLLQRNRIDESILFMQAADEKFKTSSLLTINLLLIKTYSGKAVEEDFLSAAERMKLQSFDAQAVKGIRSLVETIVSRDDGFQYAQYAVSLIDDIRSNGNYGGVPMFVRLQYYLKGMLFIKLGNFESALLNYQKAMDLYADTDAALSIVAEVANAGRPEEALALLQKAKKIYADQSVMSLKKSKFIYDDEFNRMENILKLAKSSFQSSELENK